jgi:ankyrin repeat protein
MLQLLQAKADPNTPGVLCNAALWGNTKVVEHLLDAGADVNWMAEDGETALFTATARGHVETAKCLLRRGAKITIGNDPLMAASGPGADPNLMLQLLQAKADPNTPGVLCNAALWGNTKVVEHLLDAGTDVNWMAEDGQTALFTATARGHIETVKCLLRRGAKITIGNDPLMAASNPGAHPDLILQLLQVKANPSTPESQGNAALCKQMM